MTEEEFLTGLKEDKVFDIPSELIEHRLPFVQYYLKNKTNMMVQDFSGLRLSSNLIEIIYNENTDFPLVNQAFESIKKQFIV